MITGNEIALRIKQVMQENGYTPRSLADAAKLNPTGVRDILIRKVENPKYDTLQRIASVLGMSVHQMLFEEKPDENTSSLLFIPLLDARLSAGDGAFNPYSINILDNIPFTQRFLHSKLRRNNVNGLVCADVYGESMTPTLCNGDLIIIDTENINLAAGIYAVNYQNESYVKRIEKIGSGYSLVSDNRAYTPIVIEGKNLKQFSVVGKILWAGKLF